MPTSDQYLMKQINIGMIGCGDIAHSHLAALSKIRQARVAGYVDLRQEAATAFLEQYGGSMASTDADALFDDPSIDCVHICTRHDSHADLAVRALHAGKHVMLEKPVALSLAECRRILEAEQRAGSLLMMGFKLRFYPLIQKAKRFIGKPSMVTVQIADNRWSDRSWAQDPVQGGGNLLAQGCHATDLLCYLSGGRPETIYSMASNHTHPESPHPDHCIASIRFSNGALGSWVQGDSSVAGLTGKFLIQLFSESGKSVQIYDRGRKAFFVDGKQRWLEEMATEEGFLRENQAFIEAILENRPAPVSLEEGILALQLVLGAIESARMGQPMEIHSFSQPIIST